MAAKTRADKMSVSAEQVKERLRGRHPATSTQGRITLPAAWTVIEEFEGIDLLAISANKTPPQGAQRQGDYSWIGYEVKVSRSDMRRELLEPGKRYRARRICHEFYFAVPKGLLKEEELSYEEPGQGFSGEDFQRKPCPERCRRYRKSRSVGGNKTIGVNGKAGREVRIDTVFGERVCDLREGGTERAPHPFDGPRWQWRVCEACGGKGYLEKSRVEREAPTLWIPPDVGLIEVTEKQCKVVRKSPVWQPEPLSAEQLGTLVRWVSLRPDPRHEGVIEALAEHRRRPASLVLY